MAYANIEDKRAYEAAWRRRKRREDKEWHEREKAAKRSAYVPESENPNWHEDRANENERRWRHHWWELTHLSPLLRDQLAHLTQRTMLQMKHPIFFTVINGVRQMERFNDSLPEW